MSGAVDRFRVGLMADFLDEDRRPRYGESWLAPLADDSAIDITYLAVNEDHISPEQVEGLDGLIVLTPHVTRETLRGADRLSVIARFGVGYDRVDVDACTDSDVILFITPDGVRLTMAESVVTWMLMLSKQAIVKDRITREGRWAERSEFVGACLAGRVLGLVGLGNIGGDVLRLLAPFGMQVLVSDPALDETRAIELGVERVDLDTLLTRSDYISLHCPLNDHTRGLIGAQQIERMKSSAYLINTARGPIVDESALINALRSNAIAGAALDVFEQEPVAPDNPLLSLDNVILAPHAIGWTDALIEGNGLADSRGIARVRRGEAPDHVVNAAVLDRAGLRQKLKIYRERFGA